MKDLTIGNEFKSILKFSMPILLGSVFQQLYNIVDSLIVGNYLGSASLGAVGASFPVIFVLIAMIMGLTMGASIVISQYFGIKDMEKVKKGIDTMMIIGLSLGLFIGVVGFLFAESIFVLLRLPAEIIETATAYFKVFISGSIFMFGYNGVSDILRALGDSKTPLYFLIISVVLNIILDLVFVLVCGWGIAAVALATVISQAVAFFGLTIWLNTRHTFVKINFFRLKFDKEIFFKCIKLGLPTGVQQMAVGLGATLLVSIAGGFGKDTLAGLTIGTKLDSLAILPMLSIAQALTSFVGQNAGAGHYDRIRKGYHAAMILSCGISFGLGLVFLFFNEYLVSFFSPETEVQRVASELLMICSMFYVVISAMFITNSLLRGAGDTIFPLFSTVLMLWFVRLPASYILSREWSGLGDTGIWWGNPIAWTLGFILVYIYYKKGKWKNKSVVRS
ncbi:MAG: MATE family efflux transporter [Candidatus Cloacimonetes bacterium]|nr:MATE family efflux transporter [Candidatus Cloacimonadota bacterium]